MGLKDDKLKIEEAKKYMRQVLDKAARIEERRKKNIRRLKKISILTRLFCYTRLRGIRDRIRAQAMLRSNLTIMAIGMAKKIGVLERKVRAAEQSRN